MTLNHCPICSPTSELILWHGEEYRVILVAETEYPGFCRVIWNQHVKEMSDLAVEQQQRLMRGVIATESALRDLLQPDKINLASLGNQVPHLHWHVIPRFVDDANFPDPIWAERKRAPPDKPLDSNWLHRQLASRLANLG